VYKMMPANKKQIPTVNMTSRNNYCRTSVSDDYKHYRAQYLKALAHICSLLCKNAHIVSGLPCNVSQGKNGQGVKLTTSVSFQH
jgi:hypothetical protein